MARHHRLRPRRLDPGGREHHRHGLDGYRADGPKKRRIHAGENPAGALTLTTIVLETVAIIDSPPPPPPPPIPGAPVEDETTAQQLADAATAIIAGAAGGGGALLILIIVVVIFVVCCCCKGKKGANAPRGSCVTGEATSASQVTINMGKASSSRMNDRI